MQEVNLFELKPKKRDYNQPSLTLMDKKKLASFEEDYFNNPYKIGYKHYEYNGKYLNAAKNIVEYYDLNGGGRILDVGCAKGFLLHDLNSINPSLKLNGIDISHYAIENSMNSVKNNILHGSATNIPFDDNSFDLVICCNVLINLHIDDVKKAVKEIMRVSKKHKFIQTPAYSSEVEKSNLLNWVAVSNTVLHIDEWKKIFQETKYDGDYYWFLFHDV